jgi:uncharacterized protein (DUF849 family)
VVNITTGGAATMSIEERVRPAATFKPEVASLNMGSMNFGLYPMLSRYKTFKYEWEKPYLEGSRDRIFKDHRTWQTCRKQCRTGATGAALARAYRGDARRGAKFSRSRELTRSHSEPLRGHGQKKRPIRIDS